MKVLMYSAFISAGLALEGAAQTYKFDFGPGKTEPGYTQVVAGTAYSPAMGYGFENGAGIACVDRGGSDALRGDHCTGPDDFKFSVKVPQGNYRVTFNLGDAAGASETTVKAENRRLLFDRVVAAPGRTIARTITVNRREAKSVDGTVTMSLKDRELGYLTWDDKLTFQFTGGKPVISGLELVKTSDDITVFLCGNSTVVDQLDEAGEGWCSWGQIIPRFFKPGVSIANYAESGLTAGGFLSMKRLTKLLADSKPGDYVFVEFGHNDQKNAADAAAYANNLKSFRDQILEKRAIPIFVSPTSRDGDADPKTSIGGLAETMRETAKSLNVTLIDLNAMSITLMKALGAERKAAYMDVSHFTNFGAFELGRCMAKGIKELDNNLAPFLLGDIPVFDPAKPDPVNYLTTPGTVSLIRNRSFASSQEAGVLRAATRAEFRAPGHGDAHAADGKRIPKVMSPPD